MANTNQINDTFIPVAAQAISEKRFIAFSGATGLVQHAGDGADAIAVSNDDSPSSGESASLAISASMITGFSRLEIEAGAAIASGASIASDAQGRAKTAATGNTIMGIALQAATAAGQVIEFLAKQQGGTAA